MYIQNVIGELLYIGIVAEKGRCYGTRWKLGYKKILRKHIIALNDLQKSLFLSDEQSVGKVIEEFIAMCNQNYEIGKFYNFRNKETGRLHIGTNNIIVNQLMDWLFLDLTAEVRKTHIQKRKVYDLLCALHNLPRVYLGKDKETLCQLMQETISEQDAIKYAFDNMSLDMKKRYQQHIHYGEKGVI